MRPNLLQRRDLAAALVIGPMIWRSALAQNGPERMATPSQTEGPFYPVTLPKDSDYDLLRNGGLSYRHPGDGGRADPSFQGFGRVTVGSDGRYRFRTIRPVPYSGRTPHIHVKVKLGSRELLTTQLYVDGDPHNERDFLWRGLPEPARAAVTVPFRPASDGLQASFPIVVAA